MKKFYKFIPAALIFIVIAAVSVSYLVIMQEKIRDESQSHLDEIFRQMNATFHNTVSRNWKVLEGWEDDVVSDRFGNLEELNTYISQKKKNCGILIAFICWISRGNIWIQGGVPDILIWEMAFPLMIEQEPVVAECTLSTGEPVFLFAIPVKKSEIDGFTFQSIAVAYHTKSLSDILTIRAFEGQANCYVIHTNGSIILRSGQKEKFDGYNYLWHLNNEDTFNVGTYSQLEREIAQGRSGMVQYSHGKKRQYLTYLPTGINDWYLMGVVPTDIVNADMNRFQMMTIVFFSVVFIICMLYIALFFMKKNEGLKQDMDVEIQYREQALFAVVIQYCRGFHHV